MDEKRKKELKKELNDFLAKNKAKIHPTMYFPRYNILPDDLKLAIMIIVKHEPRYSIDLMFEEEPTKKEAK